MKLLPFLLKELLGRYPRSFFKVGIKNSFRAKTTFVGNTLNSDIFINRVFGFGFERFYSILIDELIKVFPDGIIQQPRKMIRMVSLQPTERQNLLETNHSRGCDYYRL